MSRARERRLGISEALSRYPKKVLEFLDLHEKQQMSNNPEEKKFLQEQMNQLNKEAESLEESNIPKQNNKRTTELLNKIHENNEHSNILLAKVIKHYSKFAIITFFSAILLVNALLLQLIIWLNRDFNIYFLTPESMSWIFAIVLITGILMWSEVEKKIDKEISEYKQKQKTILSEMSYLLEDQKSNK